MKCINRFSKLSVVVSVIALLLLVSNDIAQSDVRNTGTGDPIEQALIKLNRDLLDAELRKDRALKDRVELANFVFINPGGGLEQKGVNAGPGPSLDSFELEKVQVWVHGDTAILTGRVHAKGSTRDGKGFDSRFRYMHVFVKQKGEWRLAATSAVEMAKARPKSPEAKGQSPKSTETEGQTKPSINR